MSRSVASSASSRDTQNARKLRVSPGASGRVWLQPQDAGPSLAWSSQALVGGRALPTTQARKEPSLIR